jgi:hypothetical protein
MDFHTICNELAESIKEIARFMDVELDPNNLPEEPVTKKQSNDKKAEWANKFISEFNLNNELIKGYSGSHLNKIKRRLNLF